MSQLYTLRRSLLAVALVLLACVVPSTALAGRCDDGGSPLPVVPQRGPGDEGGVGGTGVEPEGGIGGTGIARPGDEGGIGGTGVEADEKAATGTEALAKAATGVESDVEIAVFGTVTGFASICVGGTEIHYAADTPVQINGVASSVDALAVGHVVELVAGGNGDELTARTIAVEHVLSGPVTGVSDGGDRIEVMGQEVLLGETMMPQAVDVDSWVDVSGLWRGDEVVVASRIETAAGREQARVVGSMQATGDVPVRIGNVPISLPEDVAVPATSEVVVAGRWVNGALVAERVGVSRRATWPGRVRRVQIEGYVRAADSPREVQVAGWPVDVPAAERDSWTRVPLDRRVRLDAVLDKSGRLIPERVVFPGAPPRDRPFDLRGPGVSGDEGAGPPKGANPPPGRAGHPPGAHDFAGPPPGGKAPMAPPPRLQRPRLARPPLPERPRRPDIPRAQRPPPPPRGGRRPPMPPPMR